ncbi:hypothetical protein [Streptomyces sp. NPDC057238]
MTTLFGTFPHEALKESGVDGRWVTPVAAYPTPLTALEARAASS